MLLGTLRRIEGGLLLCAVLAALPSRLLGWVSVESGQGVIQVRRAQTAAWKTVEAFPAELADGDSFRTGSRARATLRFPDGSTLALSDHASLSVELASAVRIMVRLAVGTARVRVEPRPGRPFQVRTPAAVATVRKTDFEVRVLAGGRTDFRLYRGEIGVEDNRGRQILLRANESLRVDPRGMGAPRRMASSVELARADLRGFVRREMSLEAAGQDTFMSAARGDQLAELERGRALMDARGSRVRVESFLRRPAPDQLELVVLNGRAGRSDYYFYHGTFNRTLPVEPAAALAGLTGTVGAAPDYFPTSAEIGLSNGTDSILEAYRGGHAVDLNANAVASDDVGVFFDAAGGRLADASGKAWYGVLFDDFGFYLNGRLKWGWSGTNIQSAEDAVKATGSDPVTGGALDASNAYVDSSGFLWTRSGRTLTFPDAGAARRYFYESYFDGSFIAWDDRSLDGEGKTAGADAVGGALGGAGFAALSRLRNYGLEITASEFGGRRIDLLIDPNVLIRTGWIK